tara:strand:+ start:20 stop:1141 length:1122 start_codon:yes stop_codon:yes gene_type:complete
MANQTIIQAAGQRYAPIKTDYSGYIQGLASVATALVEKRKLVSKKAQSISDLTTKTTGDIDFAPYKDFIKSEFRSGKYSQEQTINILENLNMDKEKHKELVELRDKLAANGVSSGEDAIFENWVMSYTLKDFDKAITVKHKGGMGVSGIYDKKKEIKIDYIIDDNRIKVLDFDGEGYITVDEALARVKNATSKSDGVKVKEVIRTFKNKVSSTTSSDSENNFHTQKGNTVDLIDDLFEYGVRDKSGNVTISADRVKRSFMFDQTITTRKGAYRDPNDLNALMSQETGGVFQPDGPDNIKISFIDYYLSKEGLIPDEVKELYQKFINDYVPGGEVSEEMKNKLAASIMEYDDNINDDLSLFIDNVLGRYYIPIN